MLSEKSSDQPDNEIPKVSDAESPQEENPSSTPEPAEGEVQAESPEAQPEAEPLETVPVSEERAAAAGFAGQVLEACPSCATLMDVTEQTPLAKIFCPSCGQSLRARKQFNNYRLLEVVGEGGMGSVYKALDCNLNRHVALKVLKREFSGDAEGRAKLEKEARITATINHPHVVKVFSFGEDHGQFYIAMELVAQGSLDQLMNMLRRVSEAQILEVGIQVAEGLEEALDHDLIHRDLKPGNILFTGPHTVKLVDFGLAIVMDEEASVRGEIWGTPYYIAPEKLDNQPEDFRSDIYSLGGTMFHALAGRPPYEAETASMVALKQLKSQNVSLQAFAPDVSSETAYVVNRMLSKNPDERYPSYRELIEHLQYARHKLIERTQKPKQPKARVVMETQETKNFTAFLSLGILAALLIAGVLLYVFREPIFGVKVSQEKAAQSAVHSAAEFKEMFNQAIQSMVNRQFDEARAEFGRLAALPGIGQPQKNWALMNEGLAYIMTDNPQAASKIFAKLSKSSLFSTEEKDNVLANFFIEGSKQLVDPEKPVPASITNLYSNQNEEAFGLLCFGLHSWQLGALRDAGPILKSFSRARLPAGSADSWILDYKPLAAIYVADWDKLRPLEDGLPRATTPAAAQTLLDKLRKSRGEMQSGSQVTDRLDVIEKELIAKGAK